MSRFKKYEKINTTVTRGPSSNMHVWKSPNSLVEVDSQVIGSEPVSVIFGFWIHILAEIKIGKLCCSVYLNYIILFTIHNIIKIQQHHYSDIF